MNSRISISPEICHGQACISGTLIPVYQLLRMLACGDSIEDLLREYPPVTREDILACFDFFRGSGTGGPCPSQRQPRLPASWQFHYIDEGTIPCLVWPPQLLRVLLPSLVARCRQRRCAEHFVYKRSQVRVVLRQRRRVT